MIATRLAVLSLGLCLSLPGAHASQAERIGPSTRSVGMAGSRDLFEDGAGPLPTQAAALGLSRGDIIRLHYVGGHIELSEVERVSWADGSSEPLVHSAIDPHTVSADLLKSFGPWLKVGASIQVALPNLYWHRSKDPWVPYASRWENRFAQSLGTVGASVRIPVRGLPSRADQTKSGSDPALQGGLWLGAAVSLVPQGIIDIDLGLEGRGGGDNGEVYISLDSVDLIARPVFRPQLSLLFDFGTVAEKLDGLRIAASWRNEVTVEISPIHLLIEVEELGQLNSLFGFVERLQAEIWLGLVDLYDPHQLRIALGWERPRWAAQCAVQWNGWSGAQASFARVLAEGGEVNQTFEIRLPGDNGIRYSYPVANARPRIQSLSRQLGSELGPRGAATRDRARRIRARTGLRHPRRLPLRERQRAAGRGTGRRTRRRRLRRGTGAGSKGACSAGLGGAAPR